MTALVIGATGLVGSNLIDLLSDDSRFTRVIVFTRRSLPKQYSKVEERLVELGKPDQWTHLVQGDVLFSTLGTTLKKAGSKGAQFIVDYTYQYLFAKAAAANKVAHYVLVSAAYAKPNARVFYSRMKGELERDVQKFLFQSISIIKPGFIAGPRIEKRIGERMMLPVFNVLHHLPGLKTLKPIQASTIARAMINAVFVHPKTVNTYELLEVFELAKPIANVAE